NGEKKELVEEVVALSKRYGITTPYTSYLIVPDGVAPVVERPVKGGHGVPKVQFGPLPGGAPAPALKPTTSSAAPLKVETFARMANAEPGQLAQSRFGYSDKNFKALPKGPGKDDRSKQAEEKWNAYNEAAQAFQNRRYDQTQAGKLGVDLSQQTVNLRN